MFINKQTKNRSQDRIFVWLGMRDSNPRSWDQNPLPYRLANPYHYDASYYSTP